MKKLFTLILALVLLMPFGSNKIVKADDACKLASPQNVRVEGRNLVWDAVDGANLYYIVIDDTSLHYAYEDTNTFDIFSLEEDMDVVGNKMQFSVKAMVNSDKTSHECDSGLTSTGWIYFPDFEDVELKVYTNGYESNEGGEVDLIPTSDDPNLVNVAITAADSAYTVKVNGQEVELLDEFYANVQITLSDLGEEPVIRVDFDLPVIKTVIYLDFGKGHEDLAKKACKLLSLDMNCKVKGSVMTIIIESQEDISEFPASLIMGQLREMLAYIFSEESSTIDNGEEYIAISSKQNLSTFEEIEDGYSDLDTKLKDIDNKLYVIWDYYTCSGKQQWTLGNTGQVNYTFERHFEDKGYDNPDADVIIPSSFEMFERVLVDGKQVPEKYIFVKEGSLKLAIKDTYLNTLSVGEHEVVVEFKPFSSLRYAATDEKITGTSVLVVVQGSSTNTKYAIPTTGVE